MPSDWNTGKKILYAFIGTLFNKDKPDIDGYHYYNTVQDSGIYFGLQHNSKVGEPNMHQHIHVFLDSNTGRWTWQLTCRDRKHTGSVAGHGHDEYDHRDEIGFLNNDTGDVELLIDMIRTRYADPFSVDWEEGEQDFQDLINMINKWKVALNKCLSSWLGRGLGRTESGKHWLTAVYGLNGWQWENGRGQVKPAPRFWQNTVDYDIDEFLSQSLTKMTVVEEDDDDDDVAGFERESEPTVAQRQPVECRFGHKCRRINCHFEHPTGRLIDTPCRYGQGCTNPGCHFGPPGHGVSQLPFMGGGNRKTRTRRRSKTRRRSNIRRKKMTRRRSNTRRRSMKKKRNTMKRTRL